MGSDSSGRTRHQRFRLVGDLLHEEMLAERTYEAARSFSDLVWQIILGWQYFEKSTMGGQLVTAADSIGSNIAEGAGRGTDKENQRFIRIARGSLYELKFRLGRAISRGLIKESEINAYKA